MSADPGVIADLQAKGIEYEEMECDPELADTAQFCEAYGIPLDQSANAILVASRKPEGHSAVCLVLATTRLDVNGAVRRRLGVRKVSFAPADLTKELTGQEIGGVTVFGLPSEVPVWIDSAVIGQPWVIVGAGSRTAKIKLDPSQFLSMDGYEVVEELAKPFPSD
ncbi:MAG: YbaK/EbsC family protein [Actinomycetota bacterium]|nr:YbaK/EbsC family protein [Actinomycetota bacterium]